MALKPKEKTDLNALVNPAQILLEYEQVLAEWGYIPVDAPDPTERDALRVLEKRIRGKAARKPAA